MLFVILLHLPPAAAVDGTVLPAADRFASRVAAPPPPLTLRPAVVDFAAGGAVGRSRAVDDDRPPDADVDLTLVGTFRDFVDASSGFFRS